MTLSKKIISVFQRDLMLFIATFLTNIIAARTLGPKVFGIWMFLTMVLTYAEAFGRLKVDIASVYFIGKKKYSKEDILFNINLIAIASSIVVVLFIFFSKDLIFNNVFSGDLIQYKNHFLLILAQIPLQYLYLNVSYFYIAEEDIKTYGRMLIIQSFGNMFLVILFIHILNIGLWSMIISILFSTSVSLCYGWQKIIKNKLSKGKLSRKICVDLIRYGINFYFSGVLAQMNESGSRLAALSLMSPTQIGHLSQGQSIAQGLNKFPGAITSLLFSRVSKVVDSEAVKITCLAFRLVLILMLGVGAILWIISDDLIIVLYGASYEDIGSVVRYLLPGIIISGACSILTNYFNGSGDAKLVPKIQLIPMIVQITLTWAMIDFFGWRGAAISVAAGLFMYGVITIIVFIRITNTKLSNLVPIRSDFKYLLSKLKHIYR